MESIPQKSQQSPLIYSRNIRISLGNLAKFKGNKDLKVKNDLKMKWGQVYTKSWGKMVEKS